MICFRDHKPLLICLYPQRPLPCNHRHGLPMFVNRGIANTRYHQPRLVNPLTDAGYLFGGQECSRCGTSGTQRVRTTDIERHKSKEADRQMKAQGLEGTASQYLHFTPDCNTYLNSPADSSLFLIPHPVNQRRRAPGPNHTSAIHPVPIPS